jgi:hypothetical protein
MARAGIACASAAAATLAAYRSPARVMSAVDANASADSLAPSLQVRSIVSHSVLDKSIEDGP